MSRFLYYKEKRKRKETIKSSGLFLEINTSATGLGIEINTLSHVPRNKPFEALGLGPRTSGLKINSHRPEARGVYSEARTKNVACMCAIKFLSYAYVYVMKCHKKLSIVPMIIVSCPWCALLNATRAHAWYTYTSPAYTAPPPRQEFTLNYHSN